MLEIEKTLIEKMEKIWEVWCENECPALELSSESRTLSIFKWLFPTRFCCGWLAAVGALCVSCLIHKLWVTVPVIAISYILFRHLAHKYLE